MAAVPMSARFADNHRDITRQCAVAILLNNGADLNLPIEHEWARPLAQAEKKHSEMCTLLKKHMS